MFVENRAGKASSSAVVMVEDMESEHLPNMPEFVSIFKDQVVEREGDSVHFVCEVRGVPSPSLIWLFNGNTIQLSEEIQSRIDGNTHTLLIPSFKRKFVGTYTAIAQNVYGEIHWSATSKFKETTPKQIEFKKVTLCFGMVDNCYLG